MHVCDESGKELSSHLYGYDHAGNKTSMVETVNGKKTETTFSYDDCDRLISQKTL